MIAASALRLRDARRLAPLAAVARRAGRFLAPEAFALEAFLRLAPDFRLAEVFLEEVFLAEAFLAVRFLAPVPFLALAEELRFLATVFLAATFFVERFFATLGAAAFADFAFFARFAFAISNLLAYCKQSDNTNIAQMLSKYISSEHFFYFFSKLFSK